MFSISPQPPSPSTSDAIKDVSLATFKTDVIEASKSCLVLVDFWATWCQPCKQLTPLLEKLCLESKGTIKLAKIDVDKDQSIAQQMGVQSVPSVFAFFEGRPVDAFSGALPEAQIKTWLATLLKTTGVAGGEEKAGLETALKQAADFLTAKDVATARSIYADILDMEPDNAVAYAGLVRCFIDEGDAPNARQVFDAAPVELAKNAAMQSVRAALELAEQVGSGGAALDELKAKLDLNPEDHQVRFDLALAYYAAGQKEEAVDRLLEIVKKARQWNEDAARKQLIKFFEAFGVMDPLTVSARKRLSTILFS